MKSFLDWLLGPYHHYQCHFGHRWCMRGHKLSRFQPCPDCSEAGMNVEGREITEAQYSSIPPLRSPHA